MKNFLLSILACVVSFFVTYYGLNKYSDTILDSNTSEKTVEQNTDLDDNKEKTDEEERIVTDNDTTSIVKSDTINTPNKEKDYLVNTDINKLETDLKAWKNYTKENIELSYDFLAVDIDDNVIEKEDFLSKLKTGLYIPLKVESDEFIYKLYKLTEKADKKIGKSIRSSSSIALHYYKKEGQALPEFDFTDLDGNIFNKKTTKGKIKIIKCWFINCVVCVQEFPELNELYDHYESNNNIVFFSLAFDKSAKLKKFLSKKEFRYPVIGEQKNYMTKKLELKQYPTHLIIDEENNIIKMVSNVKALTTILDQLVGNEGFNSNDDDEIETDF